MAEAFVRRGVRYKLASTRPNRWGSGKIHVLYYDRLNKMWRLVCRRRPGAYAMVDDEPRNTPVTCTTCRVVMEKSSVR